MEFASQLGIRVPRIQRSIQIDDGFYCIMDWIPGQTLDVEWPELGWIASLRLAFKLRQIIRRLRSAESISCGSLATGNCRSYYLDDSFGLPPRATVDQVNAFVNFWASLVTPRQEVKKTPAEHSSARGRFFYLMNHLSSRITIWHVVISYWTARDGFGLWIGIVRGFIPSSF